MALFTELPPAQIRRRLPRAVQDALAGLDKMRHQYAEAQQADHGVRVESDGQGGWHFHVDSANHPAVVDARDRDSQELLAVLDALEPGQAVPSDVAQGRHVRALEQTALAARRTVEALDGRVRAAELTLAEAVRRHWPEIEAGMADQFEEAEATYRAAYAEMQRTAGAYALERGMLAWVRRAADARREAELEGPIPFWRWGPNTPADDLPAVLRPGWEPGATRGNRIQEAQRATDPQPSEDRPLAALAAQARRAGA